MKMGPRMKLPTMPKVGTPRTMTKIHPAAQARIRLPQGAVNTSQADPAPWLPGVGKI